LDKEDSRTQSIILTFSSAAYAKYTEAIALAPESAILYSNRAAALMKMGKLDLALNDATKYTLPKHR
jgi:Flp pilus assembly protein TadD